MNDKRSWAHHWALQGFYIFPVHPNSKRPMPQEDWAGAATRDPAQIEAWWSERPDANIGACPGASGHLVIDLDVKKADGFASMRALEAELGELPATLVTQTASGGRHAWLALEGSCKSTVGKLGPSIDTRGTWGDRAGYVLMPGSEFEGNPYTIAVDAPVAPAPEAWAERLRWLGRSDERREAQESVEIDRPEQIARAKAYLDGLISAGDVAIEGSGGNARTFRLFAMLRDMGVSEDAAVELVQGPWNEACLPPWSPEELDMIARNAYSYSQNEAAAKASGDGSGFASIPIPENSTPPPAPAERKSRFTPLTVDEMGDIAEPAWLVPGWIPHYELSLLYGAPGSMKSFVALDMALSVAAGRLPWNATGDAKTFPVVYIAGEGQIGVAKKRIPAWLKHHKLDVELPFHLIREAPLARNGNPELAELFAAIEKKCGAALPRLIIFDTHARVMSGLDENSVQDTSKTIEFYDEIRKRYSCAGLIIHHSGKDGAQERGSSALRGACETVLRTDKDGAGATVLRCEKMKDAESPAPIAFGIVKSDPSIVLVPREPVKKEYARSQLYLDAVSVLREHGAYSLGTALSTASLAASMPQLKEEPNVEAEQAARAKLEASLRAAAKKELRALTAPDVAPLQWILPALPAQQ